MELSTCALKKVYLMKSNFVVGLLLGIVTLFSGAPHYIKTSLFVVFFMITMDTVTGLMAAIACKELRSSSMRQKLVMKSVQYSILLTLTFAATTVSQTWLFFGAGLTAIMTIEATSLLENLSRFQRYSGVSLGAVSSLLVLMSGYFQVTQEDKAHTIVTATTIPAHPSEEPTIAVTVESTHDKPKEKKV